MTKYWLIWGEGIYGLPYCLDDAKDVVRSEYPGARIVADPDHVGRFRAVFHGETIASLRPASVVSLTITLEIYGDSKDALEVVEALLDAGVPQDEINDHEHESAGPLHVRSAVVDIVDVSRGES